MKRLDTITTIGSCALLAAAAACSAMPPFSGTAFLSTEIITDDDFSTFQEATYEGMGSRWVFDRRVNQFVFQPMHLFDATFSDGLTSEVQVNPNDFPTVSAATVESDLYALEVGRLPKSLRTDVDSITIHKGVNPFGGGNNNILIHTGQAVRYGGYLGEILFHEAVHTSYDAAHRSSPGWLAAQQSDPTFISTYARDNPNREDVAESLLPWYALRYTDALQPWQVNAIEAAIPARLDYFDGLPFELNQAPVLGDYNSDGRVDAADYVVWRDTEGSTDDLRADGSGNGLIDREDYQLWSNNYGSVAEEAGAFSVPEVGSGLLVGLASLISSCGRRNRSALG